MKITRFLFKNYEASNNPFGILALIKTYPSEPFFEHCISTVTKLNYSECNLKHFVLKALTSNPPIIKEVELIVTAEYLASYIAIL